MPKKVTRREPALTVALMRKRLRAHASAADAVFLQRFFKTGAGEYGEGDVFIGVRVPDMRRVCRACETAALPTVRALLRSRLRDHAHPAAGGPPGGASARRRGRQRARPRR